MNCAAYIYCPKPPRVPSAGPLNFFGAGCGRGQLDGTKRDGIHQAVARHDARHLLTSDKSRPTNRCMKIGNSFVVVGGRMGTAA